MSLPNPDLLKPASSLELQTTSREPEDFTIIPIRHFLSLEFQRWGVGAKIINNDAINNVIFRLHSDRGRVRIVRPSTEVSINEWFDIIIVTPDAVTGSGQLELDLVGFEEAQRKK